MNRMAGIFLMTAAMTVASGAVLDAPIGAASGVVSGVEVSQGHSEYGSARRYLAAGVLLGAETVVAGQAPTANAAGTQQTGADSVAAGAGIFQQNCAFCHGRDAAGGESGPDLTRSKLVAEDVAGNKIGDVIHNGRLEKGMPRFPLSEGDTASVVAFIHSQTLKAQTQTGKRRGVEVADLQTGNVEAGKKYFNGAGGCASCHSPSGDLAGIASKYQGLQLEERMLYPRDAKSTVSVKLPSGQTVEGALAYVDEFTIGLRDSTGTFRSWPIAAVQHKISSPVDAHVELFGKYTDDDIHNLMAYIQTLK
jgi:cytochrome c oxidase cbb3-type subunit III